jgi:hypothetical protein
MALAIVAAAGTRPMGGGLVRNLGNFPVPTLIVLVVVAVAAWRWWLARRGPDRTSTGQPVTRSA